MVLFGIVCAGELGNRILSKKPGKKHSSSSSSSSSSPSPPQREDGSSKRRKSNPEYSSGGGNFEHIEGTEKASSMQCGGLHQKDFITCLQDNNVEVARNCATSICGEKCTVNNTSGTPNSRRLSNQPQTVRLLHEIGYLKQRLLPGKSRSSSHRSNGGNKPCTVDIIFKGGLTWEVYLNQ